MAEKRKTWVRRSYYKDKFTSAHLDGQIQYPEVIRGLFRIIKAHENDCSELESKKTSRPIDIGVAVTARS